MSQHLDGKVALVTGGSRGIGAAIVKRLAADGAKVVFSYTSSPEPAERTVKEVEAAGGQAVAIQADQGTVAEATALVHQAHRTFGRLDILVNSAGVSVTGHVGDQEADIEAIHRQFDVNVRGMAATVRAAVPLINDGGRIVSIGSLAVDFMPWPGFADYMASKAAVAGYTRGWARDLGARSITVNLIQPGSVNTDMNPETSAAADLVRNMTPLGRYGQPWEVAGLVAFLAGPDAAFISGATINIDGGFSC